MVSPRRGVCSIAVELDVDEAAIFRRWGTGVVSKLGSRRRQKEISRYLCSYNSTPAPLRRIWNLLLLIDEAEVDNNNQEVFTPNFTR